MSEKRKATIYDLSRFCKSHTSCANCNLNKCGIKGSFIDCSEAIENAPDAANEVIIKWVDENPQKTYKQDFLEKYPKANITSSGRPVACRNNIYSEREYSCGYGSCEDCWNEVMEDDT